MADEDKAIESALEHLEEAERQVEHDAERLVEDQEQVKEALRELEHARHEHLITIFVGKEEYKVRPGEWNVTKLKEALGIDLARVLAQITANGLNDLPDDATIILQEGERFMTHARKGGSS